MRRLFACLLILSGGCHSTGRSYDGWTKYKGSDECIQYSSLTQIDTENVSRLKVTWEYHAGDDRKGGGAVPSLLNIRQKYTPASFDTLIQSGRRMMPAFRQLNPAERKALASVVLDLSREQKTAFIDTAPKQDVPAVLPYTITGYNKFLSKEGYPALSPPWGTLNAIDLNTGAYVWKTALGNDPAFPAAKVATGTENYGGSVVTAGGLLFIGAAKDGKLRAFNKRTGRLLWEYQLPVPAYATPAAYELDGRQYLVIACGGGKLDTKSGDSYIAFALDNK